TVASASNAHGIVNVTLDTLTGTDSVTFTGNATFGGDVSVSSQSIAFNGGTPTARATKTITPNAGAGARTTNRARPHQAAMNPTAAARRGIAQPPAVVTVTASTSGAGGITLDEANAVTLTSLTTANGAITINAGGAVIATSVVSSTDNDANDVSITATTG